MKFFSSYAAFFIIDRKGKELIAKLVYYIVALLLIITGITKIWVPISLVYTLDQVPFLPQIGVSFLATSIPLIELIIGGLLLLKMKEKQTLFVSISHLSKTFKKSSQCESPLSRAFLF